MSEIPKAYEPGLVEDKWYDRWLKEGCFTADPGRVSATRPAYSIVIPPPNVTGVLTMGHVLNNTIQDILARKARMEGKEVLWLPGTDHAGIATQTVVERTLKQSKEIRHRDDLGREKFLERVWEWKEKHGGIIIQQLKKLGCSCDWTRERFTMDPEYSKCVQKVFVDLYKKGLIYRGKRMVNWCPVSLTALSDEEVIMKEQKGALYYFKVEVAEQPGTFLTIATTRPETIPGDTAVAVNPKDPRYAQFVGKHVVRPLPAEFHREQKLIPIIGDEHVDFEFGTGVLKVTPAHDKADFEIGQRHKLGSIEVITADGKMNALAGQDLNGLDRFKARKLAIEKLIELGALEKEDPYTNNVGFSERADVPIEPRLSEQWFLKYPSVEKSRKCVANGGMKFFPDRWAKVYDHWLGGIQDWCISRQLWRGHQVPVWRPGPNAKFIGKGTSADPIDANKWPVYEADEFIRSQGLQRPDQIVVRYEPIGTPANASTPFFREVCVAPGAEDFCKELEQRGFIQDPDVLDTWCSSWLWPFATMGWTADKERDSKNATLKTFYPTTDLVTGPDIIFFWVARMIMAGYEFMGEMPFRNVYFTGIIRDKQGRKMSKSLGNSPDPLDLIAKYGADALRFGTMRGAPLGQDILFDEQNVELGRNFCNKLWNACRFRQMQSSEEVQGEINPALLTSDDKWILLKLDRAIREIDAAFAEYRFNEVTQTLYRFFWSEYCDWYVEASKASLGRPAESANAPTLQRSNAPTSPAHRANTLAVIDFVLSHALRLFHPFLPFITEELWHGMGYHGEMPADQGGRTIQFAPWPKPLEEEFKKHYGLDDGAEQFAASKYELVTQARNLRRESNIASSKRIRFVFKPTKPWSDQEIESLRLLLNAEPLEISDTFAATKGVLRALSPLGELFLPLEGLIDLEAERARLTKELAKIETEIRRAEERLNNPAFSEKVPAEILAEHRKRLVEWQAKRDHVRSALDSLSSGAEE